MVVVVVVVGGAVDVIEGAAGAGVPVEVPIFNLFVIALELKFAAPF